MMITTVQEGTVRPTGAGGERARATAGIAATVGAATWAAAMMTAGIADASGFAIREQSAAALGNAFAGSTAGAEDLSYMFFNPAALTRQHGDQVLSVATVIYQQANFHGGQASTATGAPISGGNGGRNAAELALVPALYAMWDLEEALNWGQGLRLGLAVNSPFGLATQYQEGWLGRYHALQSDLRTIAVNPMVALDVADGLSVGFGFQGQYIDAKLTNAIDFGTLGALNGVPGAIPTAQDGQAKVTGDDLGFGYNVGVLVEPWQGGRIGLAYRSAIRHQLEGDADFQLDNAGIGAALQAGSGAFADTGATAKVTTPETISLGLHQVVADDWSVMAEASWTRWDRFRTLRVKFENPAQPTSFTEEDWENTWFLAVGASWQTSDALTLRSGVSYEQSPVPNDKRTPRNPANDGVSLAVGASYRWSERLLVELSYIHTFLEDSTVDLRADDPGNLAAGNLSGNYDNAIDTCSVSIRWIF